MNLNIKSQISTEDLSGAFPQEIDGNDISALLVLADKLAGGMPGLAFSAPDKNHPQVFKLVPVCTCESCSALAKQDRVQPSESILKAFLMYVQTRSVITTKSVHEVLH